MTEACEKLRQELSAVDHAKLRSYTLDISDSRSCTNLAQFLKKEHDGLDVLVNNTGIAVKVRLDLSSNVLSQEW
jgi:short-subunit dehydrogenase involved in D-alanine esterification of teichoic acids